MNINRRNLLQRGAAAALGGLACRPAWAQKPNVKVLTGPAFGSGWRLVVPDTVENPRPVIDAIVKRIDSLMSPYAAASDLWNFNSYGTAALNMQTRLVAQAALGLARDSGGAFDPTCAPMVKKFGFGPAAISASAPAGMYSKLRIVGDRLETSLPGLTLDLNGIAKGYALDQIAAALDGLDFLFELGGEIIARGRHPSGRRWRIGIERPGTNKLQRMVEAGSDAIATSGDAAQGYLVGARRYAHVIDPRNGGPLNNNVASVSVLAPTGMLADGLATAAMVLGPAAAGTLLNMYDARALFVLRSGNDLREVAIGRFPEGASG